MSLFLIVALPFLGALLPGVMNPAGRSACAGVTFTITLAAFVGLLTNLPAVMAGRVVTAGIDWMPMLGLNFTLMLDGLGFFFALLILGIGLLIIAYARHYLSRDDNMGEFFTYLLLFQGAMVGIVLSDNILLLLVFWELTSLSSFLLIGYWKHLPAGRQGARMALTVTGMGGLAMIGGMLILGQIVGSYDLSVILQNRDLIQADPLYLPALILILLGTFTKSAQFPFHFWLPGAMAAPSPVSAYLHSATMVKAGVYLLARLNPALGGTDVWHYVIITAGAITLLTGALLAYGQTDLKRLLAYTTTSALGTLTLLIGISTELSARAAMVFLLVHALYKAALFLGVGAIDHEAGTRDIARLGGLARAMPFTAFAVVASALSMAGLPPLFGFISKELFYEAKQEVPRMGDLVTIASFAGSALVVAAAGLAAWRPFFGSRRAGAVSAHEAPPALWVGPVLLAGVSVAFGLAPDRLVVPLVEPAAGAIRGERTELVLGSWLGVSASLVQALLMLVAGAALYRLHDSALRLLAPFGWLGGWGPPRAYDALMAGIPAVATAQTRVLQHGVLGWYLVVTIATAVGVGAYALLTRGAPLTWALEPIRAAEAAVALTMIGGAVAVVRAQSLLVAIAALGSVGYGLAMVFLLFGGPDLALTQFAIETLAVLLFVLALRRLPQFRPLSSRAERRWEGALAVAGGVFVTALVLAATAAPHPTPLRDYFAEASLALAKGRNVVNVILVDFRAFDTLGEIVVLAAAALGVMALLRAPGGVPHAGGPLAVDAPVLRVAARLLVPLFLLFSVFLFVRGHNLPGGGFVGGLVGASAFALVLLSEGLAAARRLLRVEPETLVAGGLAAALISALPSALAGMPLLTGLWAETPLPVLGKPGTPLLFDAGVYLVVLGIVVAILFALAEEEA